MKSTSSMKKLKASVASLLCVLLLAMPVLSACNDASSAPDDTTASTEGSGSNDTPSKSDDNSKPVETVTLSQGTLFLVIGEAFGLTATAEPSDASDKSITWSTSDASVATVADGTVTAVGVGTATVTAIGSNGKSASCEVTVADNEYTEYDNVLYLRDKQRQNPYAVLVRAKDKSITSCNIHEQAEIISDYAFLGCSELTNITIPNSVTSIGEDAFRWCSKLKYNEYDNAMYLGNEKNPYVVLIKTADNSITSCNVHGQTKIIAGSAFFDCSALTSFDIPNSVTSIGAFAFEDCYALTSITIPDSITRIGDSAFIGCSELKYNEHDNALYLGNEQNPYVVLIKEKDNSITSCSVHEQTKIIADVAFYGCSKLTSIIIGNGVTSIGKSAFESCSKLTSITIPDSVTSISYNAFSGCSELTSIIVDKNNTVYHSYESCLIETSSKTLILGCKNSILPSDGSVTSIGDYAFSGCYALTSISIPNSVTSISAGAFKGCSKLTSVTIPGSITFFGPNAFEDCSKLTDVVIKNGVTSIGIETFKDCSELVNVTIGNSVTDIGKSAFKNCSKLTSIIIPDSVTSIGYYAFEGTGLNNVYYFGTSTEWENINIDDNEELISATRYYYSETRPTDTTLKYWHYVDGEPTTW